MDIDTRPPVSYPPPPPPPIYKDRFTFTRQPKSSVQLEPEQLETPDTVKNVLSQAMAKRRTFVSESEGEDTNEEADANDDDW